MLNRIIIQGRLGSDPEARQTPTGVSVSSFNIACDRDFKDKNTGEKDTDWVTIVVWRGTADFVCKYFKKGDMITVDGRLQMRNYTDRDGNKRTAAEVVAENVYFGTQRKNEDSGYGGGGSYAPANNSAPNYGTPAQGGGFTEMDDDDGELPF